MVKLSVVMEIVDMGVVVNCTLVVSVVSVVVTADNVLSWSALVVLVTVCVSTFVVAVNGESFLKSGLVHCCYTHLMVVVIVMVGL